MISPHRNAFHMLSLTLVSSFCLLLLVGIFRYHGSFLPSVRGAEVWEVIEIWFLWAAIVSVPVVTAILWMLRIRASMRS